MAGTYLKQGSVKEAIRVYELSPQAYQNFPEQHTTTRYLTALNNLATAYRQDGQYELALHHFTSIYATLQNRGYLQSDLAGTVMNNFAVTHTLKGEYTKAITYFEKALDIKEKLYGIDSPALMDVINNLAIAYWVVHRFSDAHPLFQRSLKLAKREVKYIFRALRKQNKFNSTNITKTSSASIHFWWSLQVYSPNY